MMVPPTVALEARRAPNSSYVASYEGGDKDVMEIGSIGWVPDFGLRS